MLLSPLHGNGTIMDLSMTGRSCSTLEITNNGLRGLLAGAGAWKWGGGCFGTVAVFVIIYLLLGAC